MDNSLMIPIKTIKQRFREFLPIVVDIETGGTNHQTDALLEICAIPLGIDETTAQWKLLDPIHHHIEPFHGANLCQKSLDFIGMQDPYHPFRFAKTEQEMLNILFSRVEKLLTKHQCKRAVLVGHNSWFDLMFLKAAWLRCKMESPFHSFTSFDTATLGGLIYGETVLVKVCQAAGIRFNQNEAHSALYDAQKTAELFCKMVNENDA
jgi:ribonuclease T